MLLRALRAEDIPFAMSLKEAAGWNQTSDDWKRFLAFRPEGCFLALWDGRPAGTVTTIDYHRGFGWIGMLLVAPELRGRGIGTGLLEAAMESLRISETVKLDATPAGKRIYQPMGFRDEFLLERRVCPRASLPAALDPPAEPFEVRPLLEADLAAATAFDAEAFGRPREQVLAAWWRGAPRYALVCESGGRIRGFCLGRKGSRFEHLGPLVAETLAAARTLLFRALEITEGRPVLLDSPVRSAEWLHLLDGLGFSVQRPFTRMARGPNRFPGKADLQWAIAGPEVG